MIVVDAVRLAASRSRADRSAQTMTSRPSIARLIVLCAVGVVIPVASSAPARACSCVPPDEGFIVESTLVPRNTLGFPWWGEVDANVRRQRLPPRHLFRLELLESGGSRNVGFDLEFAPPEFGDRAFKAWGMGLVILKPRAPLHEGAKYRVSFRRRRLSRVGRRPRSAGELQVVEVSVGTESLLPDAGTASLAVGKQTVAPLVVRKGVSCWTTIGAAQQPITFELPVSAQKWRDALLYSTTIDGTTAWRPSRNNCVDVPLGTSWVGRGKELLYVRCSGEQGTDAIARGDHLVTMIAWLPGTGVFFKAERRLSLTCN